MLGFAHDSWFVSLRLGCCYLIYFGVAVLVCELCSGYYVNLVLVLVLLGLFDLVAVDLFACGGFYLGFSVAALDCDWFIFLVLLVLFSVVISLRCCVVGGYLLLYIYYWRCLVFVLIDLLLWLWLFGGVLVVVGFGCLGIMACL